MIDDELAVRPTAIRPIGQARRADRFVMALMSPATTTADVDRHTEVFRDAVEALFSDR
jgi:hypothetical protein